MSSKNSSLTGDIVDEARQGLSKPIPCVYKEQGQAVFAYTRFVGTHKINL